MNREAIQIPRRLQPVHDLKKKRVKLFKNLPITLRIWAEIAVKIFLDFIFVRVKNP